MITHFAAEFDMAFLRDATGKHTRRDAARLEHDDFTIAKSGIEKHLRNLRRFAGAGWRFEDESVFCA